MLRLLTDRTTTGSRITGADKMGAGLSPVTTASDASAYCESQGFLLWTPSPYQGGWKGQVCIDACLETSDCPAVVGGGKQVCSQTCFSVVVDRCKWALVCMSVTLLIYMCHGTYSYFHMCDFDSFPGNYIHIYIDIDMYMDMYTYIVIYIKWALVLARLCVSHDSFICSYVRRNLFACRCAL